MDDLAFYINLIFTSKVKDLTAQLKENYTIIIVIDNKQQATRMLYFTTNIEYIFSNPQKKITSKYLRRQFSSLIYWVLYNLSCKTDTFKKREHKIGKNFLLFSFSIKLIIILLFSFNKVRIISPPFLDYSFALLDKTMMSFFAY